MEPIHATTTADVADLAARLAGARAIAFDTEFMWEATYRPELCLIQVAAEGAIGTADPLAGPDLTPLWDVMLSGPEILVHAGEHDLTILRAQTGAVPDAVFDTQIAAGFLGLGDGPGYTSLVSRVMGKRPRSGEGYTDWKRRPLSSAQIGYALDDVAYLLPMAGILQERLEERGRRTWVDEETDRVFDGVGLDADPREQWRRVSDSRKLRGKALAVLREVTAWREEEAARVNMPRQRVVPDRVLIEVARRTPTAAKAISQLRGLHPRQAGQVAEPLARVVREALEIPESDWPRRPAPHPFADDPRVEAIGALVQGLVRTKAASLDLVPRLLGNRSGLDELVRDHLAGTIESVEHPLLAGWRRDAAGAEVLRLLRGEIVLRVDPDPNGPGIAAE
ncbi:HRDC domain-containing protein [bacterium]|nr:HRDC domain-containing protein [bacterium]